MNSAEIKHLKIPAFLLNMPFSLSTDQPNNIWMNELKPEERIVNKDRALQQWRKVYQFLASKGIVYILPSQEDSLQDLPYISNLGIVLPHWKENVAVVSNFRSEPRRGETPVGEKFFRSMGFETVIAPEYFEGEADLKYLRDNIYFGAYGLRTNLNALNWFRDTYEMEMIPIKMEEEYLYHLDCVLFPLTKEKVLVCTELLEDETISKIEKVAEIIDVEVDLAYCGITNNVKCGKYVLCDSALAEFEDKNYDEKCYDEPILKDSTPTRSVIEGMRADTQEGKEFVEFEKMKLDKLTAICAENNRELVVCNLSEFYKSGALLSCLVLSLNYPQLETGISN